MRMDLSSLEDKNFWEQAGVKLPQFDIKSVKEETKENPSWVHFGAGNIFRGFVAVLQQELLNAGIEKSGIIAAETFDYDIIDKIYEPFDNLTMNVTLNADSSVNCEVIASVVEALKASNEFGADMKRLKEAFASESLQMVSYTITEKGYALRGTDGSYLKVVQEDMNNGPDSCRHAMAITAALLYHRFKSGAKPIAVVSMDNCSHNGEKLAASVKEMASAWVKNGFAEQEFLHYISDENRVSFPWSMIDKITPRPAQAVEEILQKKGIDGMVSVVTEKNTYIAPFVNAERPQYLVIEDSFPAGRPALERASVYLTDRETVNKTERMKVTTCLNPLHTAMAVTGCLLGYSLICEEMKDDDIVALIKKLGYDEGLPVVTHPGILSPQSFIDEVVNERLPNPFMPDAPQRIATDTSQKVGIRFGETIKSYISENRDLSQLKAIPFAIAAWMRYLLGIDDMGNEMSVSSDPLKQELEDRLSGIVWNDPKSYNGQLRKIIDNEVIFGLDLTKTILAEKIEGYFISMLEGEGAVRSVLRGV